MKKKYKKPVAKVTTGDLKCQVRGCTRSCFSGWRPKDHPDKMIRICLYHYRRDKDPKDSFSLFDEVGVPRPAKVRPRPKTDAQKSAKRGGTARKGTGFKAAFYKLLEEKGIGKVTFDEAHKLALSVNPDSKLDKGHFRWYVNQFRKQAKQK